MIRTSIDIYEIKDSWLKKLKPREYDLYRAIKELTCKYGLCSASYKELAEKLKIDKGAIGTPMGSLEKKGFIFRNRYAPEQYFCNHYVTKTFGPIYWNHCLNKPDVIEEEKAAFIPFLEESISFFPDLSLSEYSTKVPTIVNISVEDLVFEKGGRHLTSVYEMLRYVYKEHGNFSLDYKSFASHMERWTPDGEYSESQVKKDFKELEECGLLFINIIE